tara:strand:+ start:9833 stop:10699 length:867 start_codon:yes stop_codon:yes gene_type:complete
MTTIKLELPEGNATVLYYFGEALRNIAVNDGFVAPSETTISKTVSDMNHTVTDEPVVVAENITPPEVEVTEEHGELVKQFENPVLLSDDHIDPLDPLVVKAFEPDTDIIKLPWDKRIHSRGKTELADGTLRYARKPSDKTKEEWDLYIEEVEAELKALMAIPVIDTDTPTVMSEANEEIVTPEIVTPEIVTPEIATPEIVTPEIATPEIATPEIVTPEIVTPEIVTPEIATGPKNFGELMRFITANGKKLNNDIVKEVLAANGLASIALLAARVDLIPQIHQALLGKL